jgi:hypothetical protein
VPILWAVECLKKIHGVFAAGVGASGLRDKELEFLDREFFKVNYWGKA